MFGYGYLEWFLLFVFIWLLHYAIEHTRFLYDRRREVASHVQEEIRRKEARKHVDEMIEKHDKLNPEVNTTEKKVIN